MDNDTETGGEDGGCHKEPQTRDQRSSPTHGGGQTNLAPAQLFYLLTCPYFFLNFFLTFAVLQISGRPAGRGLVLGRFGLEESS